MTDNRVRTVAEVRHAFSKYGGNMGTEGSVAFQFKHCGQFVFAPGTSEDKVMEVALEAGADDVIAGDDGAIEVLCAPADFEAVQQALLEAAGLKPELAEVTMARREHRWNSPATTRSACRSCSTCSKTSTTCRTCTTTRCWHERRTAAAKAERGREPVPAHGRTPREAAGHASPAVDSLESEGRDMSERIEQLLEEANTLKRQALAVQQEAIALQKQTLVEQRNLIADTRANLEIARGVNERAAELQQRARRILALLLPVIVVLIGYVSWLLFFKVRV